MGFFAAGSASVSATTDPAGLYTPIAGMAAAVVSGDLNGDGIVSQTELNSVLTNYWENSPWVTANKFLQSLRWPVSIYAHQRHGVGLQRAGFVELEQSQLELPRSGLSGL